MNSLMPVIISTINECNTFHAVQKRKRKISTPAYYYVKRSLLPMEDDPKTIEVFLSDALAFAMRVRGAIANVILEDDKIVIVDLNYMGIIGASLEIPYVGYRDELLIGKLNEVYAKISTQYDRRGW